jgi:hypothetical protein
MASKEDFRKSSDLSSDSSDLSRDPEQKFYKLGKDGGKNYLYSAVEDDSWISQVPQV